MGWLRRTKLLAGLVGILSIGSACALEEASPLNPKGVEAKEQLFLMLLSLGIMILVVVVVYVIAVYVLVRFRARKGDQSIPKQVEGNVTYEIIWTVVPIVLLVILAVPTVIYSFKHDQNASKDPDAVKIKVIGHQYWWEFVYPELGIQTSQDLVLPVNKKIAFELTSVDVNHSFWIPAIGGKKDLNAGQTTHFSLTPTEVGVFKGKCAELCGASHALMDFKAVVLSEADFAAWTDNMKQPPAVSSDFSQGEAVFKANCIACHAIEPNMPSPVAPHLNGFADRERIAGVLPHDIEQLKAWIRDPESLKPGARMPGFPENRLTDAEMDALAKYLMELK